MFPPKKILFPVDFSERCTAASRMVETFAGHFQSELTLLHVLEPPTYNDVPYDPGPAIQRQLDAYLAEELKHFDLHRVLLHGEPAHQIAQYACSKGSDLIMMPTHGYGRFRRLILGSVTAKVLHDARCPVWTGVHMEQVPKLEDITFRKVVCAIDLGKQSCAALGWAAKFASELSLGLAVVHVLPDGARDQASILQARQKIEAIQESVGAVAVASVSVGEVPEAVCGFAAREGADLLVIGRSVEDGMLGRLKTNAYSIIRQSTCPVLSV